MLAQNGSSTAGMRHVGVSGLSRRGGRGVGRIAAQRWLRFFSLPVASSANVAEENASSMVLPSPSSD